MSVEGSSKPAPSCSTLRSSTAPSESRPADISGSSEPTSAPSTRRTAASTAERTPAAVESELDTATPPALAPGAAAGCISSLRASAANSASQRGRCEAQPVGASERLQSNGTAARPEEPDCQPPARPACLSRLRSADRPCAMPSAPMPAALERCSVSALSTAIPEPAHAPHCTLVWPQPCARSALANASRAALAAE